MIHFYMVDDQVIDVSRVHQLLDMMDQFIEVTFFHRIEKGNFLILYQKGIVGCTLVSGVAVEVPDVPVDCSYPESPYEI